MRKKRCGKRGIWLRRATTMRCSPIRPASRRFHQARSRGAAARQDGGCCGLPAHRGCRRHGPPCGVCGGRRDLRYRQPEGRRRDGQTDELRFSLTEHDLALISQRRLDRSGAQAGNAHRAHRRSAHPDADGEFRSRGRLHPHRRGRRARGPRPRRTAAGPNGDGHDYWCGCTGVPKHGDVFGSRRCDCGPANWMPRWRWWREGPACAVHCVPKRATHRPDAQAEAISAGRRRPTRRATSHQAGRPADARD